jgi:hypothetical protein
MDGGPACVRHEIGERLEIARDVRELLSHGFIELNRHDRRFDLFSQG